MPYPQNKSKSFIYHFTWVGILLLLMGLLFLSIAFVMQIVPLNPDSVTFYYNGVQQPATLETVQNARLLFGAIFGGLGVILGCVGIVVLAQKWIARGRAERLKAYGVCVKAAVTGCTNSIVHVNGRHMLRLNCAYPDSSGTTYIFKSGALRMDPMPFLTDGTVTVYYDEHNMKRYFVDVDESIGAGTKVVEL